jgi:hypothetical protein
MDAQYGGMDAWYGRMDGVLMLSMVAWIGPDAQYGRMNGVLMLSMLQGTTVLVSPYLMQRDDPSHSSLSLSGGSASELKASAAKPPSTEPHTHTCPLLLDPGGSDGLTPIPAGSDGLTPIHALCCWTQVGVMASHPYMPFGAGPRWDWWPLT